MKIKNNIIYHHNNNAFIFNCHYFHGAFLHSLYIICTHNVHLQNNELQDF